MHLFGGRSSNPRKLSQSTLTQKLRRVSRFCEMVVCYWVLATGLLDIVNGTGPKLSNRTV